jgi:hypothetical protein
VRPPIRSAPRDTLRPPRDTSLFGIPARPSRDTVRRPPIDTTRRPPPDTARPAPPDTNRFEVRQQSRRSRP